jgi:hypothetical protein
MKKILIIYPHFPPSNLAGVHRPRLFAQHLPAFGWEPVILTVHEKYYEELPDDNLVKLLPSGLRIEKVKAFRVTKPRLIGDIGLRSFFYLYKKAKQLIKEEGFDFLYIPVPSFYVALLGRWLHRSTGIAYGIDYIDPWVHRFPGSDQLFSRHWFSTKIARMLEPVAVKNASLITGVAEGYYKMVVERNPFLKKQAVFGGMPYGGEKKDHDKLKELNIQPYVFKKKENKIQLIYAGAMLPNAYEPLEAIFKSIQQHPATFANVEFIFIGTGKRVNDPASYAIKALAEKYNLWETAVFEYAKRIPYLDVLAHLNIADGIFVLGSTEPHYTPSKIYQAVLSEKPLMAVLHCGSSAKEVIEKSGAGVLLAFDGAGDIEKITEGFENLFQQFLSLKKTFSAASINHSLFEQYSAFNVTGILAGLLNKAVSNSKNSNQKIFGLTAL